MDGFTDWLDCITDDRGLFSPSVCNEAIMPGRVYARYRWRHRVVLCTRISTVGNARTDAVCTESFGLFASPSNINSCRRSRALKPLSVL
jgi:hypothetical protein